MLWISQIKTNQTILFREFSLTEYYFILIFFIISCILSFVLLILTFLVSMKNSNFEKLSAYECGFEPFEDTRTPFDIHFYIVAILFMIFDLEIAFLFPWAVNLRSLYYTNSFTVMMLFLIILTLGFIYEWNKGALDWSKVKKK